MHLSKDEMSRHILNNEKVRDSKSFNAADDVFLTNVNLEVKPLLTKKLSEIPEKSFE